MGHIPLFDVSSKYLSVHRFDFSLINIRRILAKTVLACTRHLAVNENSCSAASPKADASTFIQSDAGERPAVQRAFRRTSGSRGGTARRAERQTPQRSRSYQTS